LVLAGFVLLIWLPAIRCPAGLTVVAGTVAEASLYIYVVHFQVYPLFDGHPVFGVIASIAVGVLLTQLVTLLRKRLRDQRYRATRPKPVPACPPMSDNGTTPPTWRRGKLHGSSSPAKRAFRRALDLRLPLGDKSLLHERGRDDAVGANQSRGDDTASARGGR
jgi:hypothetical protein